MRSHVQGTVYLLHFTEPYRHAKHYMGKPASSGLLQASWRVGDREFTELVARQPETAGFAAWSVPPHQRRPGGSGWRRPDPQPIAVRVTQLDLPSPRRLFHGHAELSRDRVDVPDPQVHQGVWARAPLVFGQKQPHPATRHRHERRHAWLEAVLPLLGEAQAPIPADRHGGVGDAKDRDHVLVHGRTVAHRRDGSQALASAAGVEGGGARVQRSGTAATKAGDGSGITTARQESSSGLQRHHPGSPSRDNARADRSAAGTNSRLLQHWTENLPARLALHTEGRGARLVEVVITHGIGFVLARTWAGDRFLERALKRRRMAPRYCPICRAERRRGR